MLTTYGDMSELQLGTFYEYGSTKFIRYCLESGSS